MPYVTHDCRGNQIPNNALIPACHNVCITSLHDDFIHAVRKRLPDHPQVFHVGQAKPAFEGRSASTGYQHNSAVSPHLGSHSLVPVSSSSGSARSPIRRSALARLRAQSRLHPPAEWHQTKAPKYPSNEKTVCGIVAHLVYNWRRISGLEKGGHAHQPLTHAWNTSGWADWGEKAML